MTASQDPEPTALGLEGRASMRPHRQESDRTVPPWRDGRTLLVVLAFWTLFAALTASNWLLLFADQFPYPGRLVAKAFVSSYLWALLTPVVFWLAHRFSPERGARVSRVLLLGALALGCGSLVAVVEALTFVWVLHMPPLNGPMDPWDQVWSSARRYSFNDVLTFLVVLGAGFALDIFRRYRAGEREAARLQAQASRLRAEQAELQARAAQLQTQSAELNAQLAEARLSVLRAQLNPHFLFNTLNAVSALVAQDPRGVRSMIALLSELLRYTLKDSGEQEIPVHEEFRLLRLYLEILEIRYQGQLETRVVVDPGAKDALVPNLILQPIVENAVKHGIDPAGGFGTVEVCAGRVGNDLVLSVHDTGAGRSGRVSREQGNGVGLRLIRARLTELYGSEPRLELEPAPDGGTIARMVLPYHTAPFVRVPDELVRR